MTGMGVRSWPEYATALTREIEKLYSPKRYELFVGSKSDKNIHPYQKLGYNVYKTDQYECENIEIFYMEKFHKK